MATIALSPVLQQGPSYLNSRAPPLAQPMTHVSDRGSRTHCKLLPGQPWRFRSEAYLEIACASE